MAFNTVKAYGESESILDSEKGLVTKTRQANQAMAADVEGRKVIKAGSLYTNPDDATDIGVFFEDYDMTDYAGGYPASVVVAGRLKKAKVAAEVTAKADALKAQGLYLV